MAVLFEHFKSGHHVGSGGDPRGLSDFSALMSELSKLTHPARPDVDWNKAEDLCLALFRRNGVELQTAAYFTLSRTHCAGLAGMEEGIAIIDGLCAHQWPGLWPPQTHARMEILSWLASRLQQVLRTLTTGYADLAVLYRLEKVLEHLCGELQRLELQHLSRMDGLRRQIGNAVLRLENIDTGSGSRVMPVEKPITAPLISASPLVYVARDERQPMPPAGFYPARALGKAARRGFLAGMFATVMVAGCGLLGWHITRQDPAETALKATVAPLPRALGRDVLAVLATHRAAWVSPLAADMLADTRAQLSRLDSLSPLWALNTGSGLVKQAQTLWPASPEAAVIARDWQQQRLARALPLESLQEWRLAYTRLQNLADKLNGLDQQRGRYMTVSELKSAVFAIQQPLSGTPPLEELLRQLAEQQAGAASPALLAQIDGRFAQLLNRYALLAPPLSRQDDAS